MIISKKNIKRQSMNDITPKSVVVSQAETPKENIDIYDVK